MNTSASDIDSIHHPTSTVEPAYFRAANYALGSISRQRGTMMCLNDVHAFVADWGEYVALDIINYKRSDGQVVRLQDPESSNICCDIELSSNGFVNNDIISLE